MRRCWPLKTGAKKKSLGIAIACAKLLGKKKLGIFNKWKKGRMARVSWVWGGVGGTRR